MKLLILILILPTLAVASFGANASPTELLSGISIGIGQTHTRVSTDFDLPFGKVSRGETSSVTVVMARVQRPVTQGLTLGASLTTAIGDHDAGTVLRDGTLKLTRPTALDFSAGYSINEKTKLYGLLSYETAKATFSSGTLTKSARLDGFGTGLGISYQVTKTLEVDVRYKRIYYEPKKILLTFDASKDLMIYSLVYKF